MPCYHFTWHTYGSWLPDRREGYVHWSRGRQPSSPGLATCYHQQQKEPAARLTDEHQLAVIKELCQAAAKQQFRLHFVACESSHVHVLVSWSDQREAKQLSRSLRRSISLRLMQFQRRKWLARGGSCRRVRDRGHLEHLTAQYLPSHGGWKWSERRGLFR